MTNETPRTANVVHLLVADLSRTACQMPATPALNTTTIARQRDVRAVPAQLRPLSPDPPNPRPDSAAGTRKQVPL